MSVLFAVMFDETKKLTSASDLLRSSSLHSELQVEPVGMLTPQRIESEKTGRDLEFERAFTAWIIKHCPDCHNTRLPGTQPNRISIA